MIHPRTGATVEEKAPTTEELLQLNPCNKEDGLPTLTLTRQPNTRGEELLQLSQHTQHSSSGDGLIQFAIQLRCQNPSQIHQCHQDGGLVEQRARPLRSPLQRVHVSRHTLRLQADCQRIAGETGRQKANNADDLFEKSCEPLAGGEDRWLFITIPSRCNQGILSLFN